jgi:amino acid transporter
VGAVTGVRSTASFVTCVVAWFCVAGLAVYRIRHPRRDGHTPSYVPIGAAVAIAVLGACYNPSLVTPTVALPFALAYTLSVERARRFLPMIAGCIALACPVALEALGVLPSSSAFRDGMWCVVPRMTADVPTAYPALAIDLLCMIAACYYAVRFREVFSDLQHRVYVGAWQLKQLLPKDAGRTTVPPG